MQKYLSCDMKYEIVNFNFTGKGFFLEMVRDGKFVFKIPCKRFKKT